MKGNFLPKLSNWAISMTYVFSLEHLTHQHKIDPITSLNIYFMPHNIKHVYLSLEYPCNNVTLEQ